MSFLLDEKNAQCIEVQRMSFFIIKKVDFNDSEDEHSISKNYKIHCKCLNDNKN